jgi:hypothetical protein
LQHNSKRAYPDQGSEGRSHGITLMLKPMQRYRPERYYMRGLAQNGWRSMVAELIRWIPSHNASTPTSICLHASLPSLRGVGTAINPLRSTWHRAIRRQRWGQLRQRPCRARHRPVTSEVIHRAGRGARWRPSSLLPLSGWTGSTIRAHWQHPLPKPRSATKPC